MTTILLHAQAMRRLAGKDAGHSAAGGLGAKKYFFVFPRKKRFCFRFSGTIANRAQGQARPYRYDAPAMPQGENMKCRSTFGLAQQPDGDTLPGVVLRLLACLQYCSLVLF
jgi:hypothetical protein